MIVIGIDPGVNTGYAVWDADARQLLAVTSRRIDEAMQMVSRAHQSRTLHHVVFEDARLRKWLGIKGREALQGAGSIKRDCTIWAEFLGAHGIAYRAVAPQAGATKWTAQAFERLTGWTGRTNEHGRDAAMLVYGVKACAAPCATA